MDSTTSRKITVAEMAPHIHSFLPNENKVNKITDWITAWIKQGLKSKKIKPYDMLPSKGELACHIGVSQGTMQNVFRIVEDKGLIESKQKIGTYIRDNSTEKHAEKLTSKREFAIEMVKKYLVENGYRMGDTVNSTRNLAKILGISDTTTRMALSALCAEGFVVKQGKRFVVKDLNYKLKDIEEKTLAEKIAGEIKKLVRLELKGGDKIPSNKTLAKKYNVSVKTVHDAIKLLTKEGVLITKRGQYGTIVPKEVLDLYLYEKVEQKIRYYIAENSKIGDKLPTIKGFAEMFSTGEKTVKKALDNLAEDGYLMFMRGRYGGTFVTDIPQISGETYKWLAINSDYVQN